MDNLQKQLIEPFEYEDIEWRISRSYPLKNKATVLAYMTSRGVMNRLDQVFGTMGWSDEYEFIGNNVTCKLTATYDGISTSKMDGAPQTNFESFKGGISDALKRTAVKFGIGRYLYNLTENWVDLHPQRPNNVKRSNLHYLFDKESKRSLYWVSPPLPEWALPKKEEKK